MEGHQGLGCVVLAIALLGLIASCAENEPLGEGYYDLPLRVVSIEPKPDDGPIYRDQTFRIRLSGYLSTSPLTWYNTATLASGGRRASIYARYFLVDRELEIQLRNNMEPDLYYTLSLNPDTFTSVTGQALEGTTTFTYQVGDAFEPAARPFSVPTWDDVEAILAPCGDCHDDPEWKLPPMSYEALVGQRSAQDERRFLVRPFDPARSYLMHKVLASYPVRIGGAQPPVWDQQDPLLEEDLRTLAAWIRAGAKP